MSAIQVFNNPKFGNLRAFEDGDGEIWIIAKDPCDALGTATRDVRKILDDDEVSTLSQLAGNVDLIKVGPEQGGRDPLIITEAGFYKLVMRSRKPVAKPFQRWVTHEVFPSIRRHGVYATAETAERLMGDPDFMIATFQALKAERTKREALEAENGKLKPKALVGEALTQGKDKTSIGTLAKYLTQAGFKIGQNNLFKLLRHDGYLMYRDGDTVPTQRAVEMQLFAMERQRAGVHRNGSPRYRTTTRVTAKGVRYFIEKYAGQKAMVM